jgi:hypothetical protein
MYIYPQIFTYAKGSPKINYAIFVYGIVGCTFKYAKIEEASYWISNSFIALSKVFLTNPKLVYSRTENLKNFKTFREAPSYRKLDGFEKSDTKMGSEKYKLKWSKYESNVLNAIKDLFETKALSDVVLFCEGRKFLAILE